MHGSILICAQDIILQNPYKMNRLQLASVLLLCCGLASVRSQAACMLNDQREDCGYIGVNEELCTERGCCWNPKDNVPWCFYKSGPAPLPKCRINAPRFECGYFGINQEMCEASGCCWDPKESNPWCFQPFPGYVVSAVAETTLGVQVTLVMNGSSPGLSYRPNISPLMVDISSETDNRLHVKIYDPNFPRWEVPTSVSPVPDRPPKAPAKPLYSYKVADVGEEFSFSVTRTSDGETIFDTSAGILQFADQYLQLSTRLPEDFNVYGLGEHVAPLKLETRTYTLWNFDTHTPPYLNLYGSHPFYLELRPSGSAHGVFLRNSNGMDITLTRSPASLNYRVIGGILDFYFFLGPSPEAVIQQYQEVIGRPQMPPYWGLGFHQCRFGYPNVDAVEAVVDNYAANKIPLDTMWTDIDHMDHGEAFTLDPFNFPKDRMNQLINKLHNNGMHYVVVIDPGIDTDELYKPYADGLRDDIFIKDHNGNIFTGRVWPGITAFPDFLHPKANQYWENQLSEFYHNLLPVDGIWLDMNEIANFCDGECTSDWGEGHGNIAPGDPPYKIHNQGSQNTPLHVKTVNANAQHYGGVLEWDAHNMYGLTESIATNMAMMKIRGKRSFVISRSTFPSSGTHTGHWSGDNHSTKESMYYSVPGMLNFQLFGIPMVGSDICGFNGPTSEELCSRWTELGAFYTFSRNHNGKGTPPQEPYVWPSVAAISRKVLGIRYTLLPYYYTLFYKANRPVDSLDAPSATVLKPLFFEFPTDSNTYGIDRQFLIGSGVLVSPVLELGATSVHAYFPPGKWYDWYSHAVTSAMGGESLELNTPLDHIQIHVRGGSVIPMQEPALTTTESRKNPFSLLVALDGGGAAEGDLFLDDGEAIQITDYTFVEYDVANEWLTTTVSGTGYASGVPPLNTVTILGVQGTPTQAKLNGTPIAGFSFDATTSTLTLTKLKASMGEEFTITWGTAASREEL